MRTKLAPAALLASGFMDADVTTLAIDGPKTEFVRRMSKAANVSLDIRVVIDPQTDHCGYATTAGGQPYIAVNPKCAGDPVVNGKFNPFTVALLGHEIGHIALGHTTAGRTADADIKMEQLQADEFSGRLVALMGGRLRDALALAVTMPETASSPRDRNKAESIEAAAKGWEAARAQVAGVNAQSWESDSGPFHVCWQSFWMGCAATFFVIILFKR